MNMLPQTPLTKPPTFHESINDLPVHKATTTQIFHPVSESRHFTRKDAGEIFQKGLLPADERIPHPQMIGLAIEDGSIPSAERDMKAWDEIDKKDAGREAAITKKQEKRENATTTVRSGRWDFKFRDVVVDKASVGRHVRTGIGARYGVPHQDRKRGQIKIPTSVSG